MANYNEMTPDALRKEAEELRARFAAFKGKGLKLDLSRGKPDSEQINLSRGMLDAVKADSDLGAENGMDCANYGLVEGIPEARRLMADLLGLAPQEVLVGGNASLNLMHDCVGIAYVHGMPASPEPWCRRDTVKFLCPSPGYDRHFAVTGHFGIEMIPVPMDANGPDMDAVERLVLDEAVKGIWCVPKYSNPTGCTYSDEVVRRLARMKTAAPDFLILYDNAYVVHDLDPDHPDELLNIMDELKAAGNEDRIIEFCSTSKLTFPGSGIAALGTSERNLGYLAGHFALQTIGFDKLNQLRHVRFFGGIEGIRNHMRGHAQLLRPKFRAVAETLARELGGLGIASWTDPNGGYFVSLDVLDGCAKRTTELCREAGVVMTPAGATYPEGNDPADRNIRIAPTFAKPDEVLQAAELLCLCARIACAEKLLAQK